MYPTPTPTPQKGGGGDRGENRKVLLLSCAKAVSYTHLTLPTNAEV